MNQPKPDTTLDHNPADEALGAVPDEVVVSADGDISAPPPATEETRPTLATQIVLHCLKQLGVAVTDPTQDELLVSAGVQLARILWHRFGGDQDLKEARHPANAATQLDPAADSFVRSVLGHPVDLRPSRFNAQAAQRDLRRLRRARRLYAAFLPVVELLDLVICNLEQSLDAMIRDGFVRVESVVAHDSVLQRALAPVGDYLYSSARKGAASRRASLRKAEAAPAPSPAAEVTAAPAGTTVTVQSPAVPSAPSPLGAAPAAAAARTGRRARQSRR